MKTRAQELRERDRRVFAWSLGLAVALHVAAFTLWPVMRRPASEEATGAIHGFRTVAGAPVYVDLLFGPPDILAPDGTIRREPPERVLEAERMVRLPSECGSLAAEGRLPAHGRVRLTVKASGRVEVGGLTRSTGDPCGDYVVTTMAEALWYRWLPDERFPAPVELVQPVTLVMAQD